MESLKEAVTPIPARASGPGPRHAHARARGGDSFHVRAAIGAACCAPAKNAVTQHARAVANCSCASASSYLAAAPSRCLVALTTSGNSEGTAHARSTPRVSRAGHSACELNRERWAGRERVDSTTLHWHLDSYLLLVAAAPQPDSHASEGAPRRSQARLPKKEHATGDSRISRLPA